MEERDVLVFDPMLATGNSAVEDVDRLERTKPGSIRLVCLVTCPRGLKTIQDPHPDVPVNTHAIDRGQNDHGCIVRGLREAGTGFSGRNRPIPIPIPIAAHCGCRSVSMRSTLAG
jgi:uracil phosphoribosyltransferase